MDDLIAIKDTICGTFLFCVIQNKNIHGIETQAECYMLKKKER